MQTAQVWLAHRGTSSPSKAKQFTITINPELCVVPIRTYWINELLALVLLSLNTANYSIREQDDWRFTFRRESFSTCMYRWSTWR